MALITRLGPLPDEVPGPSLPASRPPPRISVHEAVGPALGASEHPVLVTIEHTVDPAGPPAFCEAMKDLAAGRHRDGAVAWLLARDVERPDSWVEAFRVPDWHELRRGLARINLADGAATERARAFHRDAEPPGVRCSLPKRGSGHAGGEDSLVTASLSCGP